MQFWRRNDSKVKRSSKVEPMVVVFGAGGFIGTYLVDRLVADGFDVIATDISRKGEAYYKKQGIPFVRLDITREKEFDALPETGVSAVVHVACLQPANVSEQEYDPKEYMKVNALGMINILEYCRRNKVPKILYTSSHLEVAEGLWEPGRYIREDAPRAINYTGEYAMYIISQNVAVDCVAHYSQNYDIKGIVCRVPPVYGYGPHIEIFKNGKPVKTGFKIFIENAVAGKPLEVWGDCKKGRDIIYVKDVVSAIILALKSDKASGLYNIASGRPLSLEEEAKGIISVFSSREHPSEIIYRPDKPNSIKPFLYDISKAKKELGWSPKYSFKEMLLDYKKEMESGRFNFLLKK
jgi:UDP-glucose 4-epimerase